VVRYRQYYISSRHGFTLIELSIVLIIIGLLTGAILVGQQLIITSEARAMVSQLEKFQTAYTTFQIKYNCVPGDCATASALGLGSSGDGNGLIDLIASATDPSCATYEYDQSGLCVTNQLAEAGTTAIQSGGFFFQPNSEPNLFWVHLSNAGLIPGNYREVLAGDTNTTLTAGMDQIAPLAATGKTHLIVYAYNGHNYIRTGMVSVANSAQPNVHGMGAVSGIQAYYVTDKISDTSIPDVMVPNKKVYAVYDFPTGVTSFWLSMAPSDDSAAFYTASSWCFTTATAPFTFKENGRCNLVYRLD